MTRDEKYRLYEAVQVAADYQVADTVSGSDEDRALARLVQAGLQEVMYALSVDAPEDYGEEEIRRHREYSQRFVLDARSLMPRNRQEWGDETERAYRSFMELLNGRG